ncbi:M1 family metallopeptidase [Flavobacterium sp.]
MRILSFLLLSAFTFAQQTQNVDFKTVKGNISINPTEKKVLGSIKYIFEVRKMMDTIKIDAQKMSFTSVKINNKQVKFTNSGKTLNLFEGFKKGKNSLTFDYEAFPKQTMYFTGVENNLQIWTQGQGKYTSHWFPSFDDVNEKVIFNLNITFDKKYNVIANGFLKTTYTSSNSKKWYYEMKQPMSSYLLAIAIGDFVNKVTPSKSGIPLQFFIQPKDTAKFEPTYRYSKQIFDYFEKEIGVKYPWKIYKQVPVEDFLYAGMENTTTTIFAQDFVIDSTAFNDRNYVNVNAHELAHQWFGDLVTAKSGKHHWLQEGFATYYALLAEREVFGDDYFYHQLYRSSLQLRNASKTDTIPVMNEKASSLSFYQKGAWALHFIRESIGAKSFQKAVKSYLKKYKFRNVDTDDFLAEIKKVAPFFDTDNFKKTWLEDYHFQMEVANSLLKKNQFINTLFETQQLRKKSVAENNSKFIELLQSDSFYPVKTEILYQIRDTPFEEKESLLRLALKTNDVKVRQAVAEFVKDIPVDFKAEYETLLNDSSYETKEIAFMNLWKNFPNDRSVYLAKAKNWVGGNDKSLRILYLTFALESSDFSEEEQTSYLDELLNYTSPNFESSVRQNAFVTLFSINISVDILLKNLVNATTHHKWQFTKYSRDKIRSLLMTDDYRRQFEQILITLPDGEKTNLQNLLNEKP